MSANVSTKSIYQPYKQIKDIATNETMFLSTITDENEERFDKLVYKVNTDQSKDVTKWKPIEESFDISDSAFIIPQEKYTIYNGKLFIIIGKDYERILKYTTENDKLLFVYVACASMLSLHKRGLIVGSVNKDNVVKGDEKVGFIGYGLGAITSSHSKEKDLKQLRKIISDLFPAFDYKENDFIEKILSLKIWLRDEAVDYEIKGLLEKVYKEFPELDPSIEENNRKMNDKLYITYEESGGEGCTLELKNKDPCIAMKTKMRISSMDQFKINPKVFNLKSEFLIPQKYYSFTPNGSDVLIIGEENKFASIAQQSILFYNKDMSYQTLYTLACAMYILHQKGIPFGSLSDCICQNGMNYVCFPYGITNRNGPNEDSIEKDLENYRDLFCQYITGFKRNEVTLEAVITGKILPVYPIPFAMRQTIRNAKNEFTFLHINIDIGETAGNSLTYDFLPPEYKNLPKDMVDSMIQGLQAIYGGTPEEAFKKMQEVTKQNMEMGQAALQKQADIQQGIIEEEKEDPNHPFSFAHRNLIINKLSHMDQGTFCIASVVDMSGKEMNSLGHIIYKNTPDGYHPPDSIFNIDFETLNSFEGYSFKDNELVLISNYKNECVSQMGKATVFETRIRNEPIVTGMFITGIAASIVFLHKLGIVIGGISIDTLFIHCNNMTPFIYQYGNPEIVGKTMDDDEKEFLALCKDYYPHSFEKVSGSVAEDIITGKIILVDSKDVESYRTRLLELLQKQINIGSLNNPSVEIKEYHEEKEISNKEIKNIEDIPDLDKIDNTNNDNINNTTWNNNNTYDDVLNMTLTSTNITPQVQQYIRHAMKILKINPLQDKFNAANILTYYSHVIYNSYPIKRSRELMQHCGLNNIRAFDEYYTLYNPEAGNVPISVAFQLIRDFSPHMVPPQSAFELDENILIDNAKKGDAAAMYRMGMSINDRELIEKAAKWNYAPAVYQLGRMNKDSNMINQAASQDLPIAKAFKEIPNFKNSDKKLVEEYIEKYPESEVTAELILYGIHTEMNPSKAKKILQKTESFFKLGMYYLFYGKTNFDKALENFNLGADKGDSRCKFASIIIQIYIKEKDRAEFENEIQELADEGLPQAKFFIGEKEEAAKAGLRTAIFEYGRDICFGINGQKRCFVKGYPYIMMAHRLGHPYAYSLLEVLGKDTDPIEIPDDVTGLSDKDLLDLSNKLLEGIYIEQDDAKAFELINIAAERGSEQAKYQKARLLQYGIGVDKNIDEAKKIYTELNNEDSLCQLGIIQMESGETESQMTLSQAINLGSPRAMFIFGMLKYKNNSQKYIGKAAQKGVPDAKFLLPYFQKFEGGNKEVDLFENNMKLIEQGYLPAYFGIPHCTKYPEDIGSIEIQYFERMKYVMETTRKEWMFQGLGINSHPFHEDDLFKPGFRKNGYFPKDPVIVDEVNTVFHPVNLYSMMAQLGNPACLTYDSCSILNNKNSFLLPIHKVTEEFRNAAQRGSPNALLQLANFFMLGVGVPQSKRLAAYYGIESMKKCLNVGGELSEFVCSPKFSEDFFKLNMKDIGFENMSNAAFGKQKGKSSDSKFKSFMEPDPDIDPFSESSIVGKTQGEISIEGTVNLEEINKNIFVIRDTSLDFGDSTTIFNYGSALFYGDEGVAEDKEAAKLQFMKIKTDPASIFMLQTKYSAPVKPIFRRKISKKEEQFLGGNMLEPYVEKEWCACCKCCDCCKKDPNNIDDEEEGVVGKGIDFGMMVKSVWPIIAVVIEIIKTFQGASVSTNNKNISISPTIDKIINWSTTLIRKIINWTQIKEISASQMGVLMSIFVLIGISVPLFSLKRGAPVLLLVLYSTLLFAPVAIGISMENWILFGIFVVYYLIVWPIIWFISTKIRDKNIIHYILTPLYIPQTIVGFMLVGFNILIKGPDRGIVLKLMPYLKAYFNPEKIDDFLATEYCYYEIMKINEDSTLNCIVSWTLSLTIIDLLLVWILGLCPIFYFALAVTIIILIAIIVVALMKVYYVKFTMKVLSFYTVFVFEKILELILMPAVDLITGDDAPTLTKINTTVIVVAAIILPFLFISFISLSVNNQAKTYHPAAYYGFMASTISVSAVCDGLKIRYVFWPLVDNLYQIAYALIAALGDSIYAAVLAIVYFIVIWAFRPNLMATDNIIMSGEPFALFVFNLILFIKKDSIPTWAAYALVAFAVAPALICLVYYYVWQKGMYFDVMRADIQREYDRLVREGKDVGPDSVIDELHTWRMYRKAIPAEVKRLKFMRHFMLNDPSAYEEDDFPDPSFLQKGIDERSPVFIDILCAAGFTIGAFLFYLQIGESISFN